MKLLKLIFTLFVLATCMSIAENDQNMSAEEAQYYDQAKKIWESLTPQHGKIKLANGVATLDVPENFYYLSPEDTKTVLVKVWGNPDNGLTTLGMLFPKGTTPFDADAWGVTIKYQEDGYVSDEDAKDIDYDDMLTQMQDDTEQESQARVKQGYEAISLVGWAAKPYYDANTHKLHWAQEIKFGDQDVNTLNYNIRILGRKGVLILNFIAGMDQLDFIDTQIDTVLHIAEFDDGQRYADFNPDIDKVAAYGIGALIAGKVAAKLGLLATILIFLKKFWILAILGMGGFFKKIFGKKEESFTPDLTQNEEDTQS